MDTLRLHSKESSNIFVVRESSRETHQTNHRLSGLNLTKRARHDRLQNWPTVVVKQMDLINNDQPYELCVGSLATFACNNMY